MAQPTKAKDSAQQRQYFTSAVENAELPNLIDHQLRSFDWFVQEGLQEIFQEVNPIEDYTGTKLELRFKDYHFEDPKMSEADARENNVSYEAPLKAVVELTNKVTGEVLTVIVFVQSFLDTCTQQFDLTDIPYTLAIACRRLLCFIRLDQCEHFF